MHVETGQAFELSITALELRSAFPDLSQAVKFLNGSMCIKQMSTDAEGLEVRRLAAALFKASLLAVLFGHSRRASSPG